MSNSPSTQFKSPLTPLYKRGEGEEVKDRAMTEHVQAFDYHRDGQGILYFGLCDSKSVTTIVKIVPKEVSIVGGAIIFLQEAWAGGTPDALALDGAPLGRAKSFRRFVEGEGVKLRILSPADRELCWKLERNFFPRVAG